MPFRVKIAIDFLTHLCDDRSRQLRFPVPLSDGRLTGRTADSGSPGTPRGQRREEVVIGLGWGGGGGGGRVVLGGARAVANTVAVQ